MKSIRFTKADRAGLNYYAKGEIAGVPDGEADRLIEIGSAVPASRRVLFGAVQSTPGHPLVPPKVSKDIIMPLPGPPRDPVNVTKEVTKPVKDGYTRGSK